MDCEKSQTITNIVVSILNSFDHRLSALETSMRPTHVGLLLAFCLGRHKISFSSRWTLNLVIE
ncbi:hypothetical protein GBA52_028240 [Prunus armeniaca]|nr:hypothetical protein GBA52_028240 [Prunus armeniaca]